MIFYYKLCFLYYGMQMIVGPPLPCPALRGKTSLSSSLAARQPRIIAAATRSATAARPAFIVAILSPCIHCRRHPSISPRILAHLPHCSSPPLLAPCMPTLARLVPPFIAATAATRCFHRSLLAFIDSIPRSLPLLAPAHTDHCRRHSLLAP